MIGKIQVMLHTANLLMNLFPLRSLKTPKNLLSILVFSSLIRLGFVLPTYLTVPIQVLIVVANLIKKYQSKLLYLPKIPGLPQSPEQNPDGMRNPQECKLPYQNIQLQTQDGEKLRGWFINPYPKENPLIIFFHENAGNIGTRLPYIQHYIEKVKANFLIVAYRGYSDSTGEPSQEGLMIDAKTILKFATTKSNSIFIHGRSLGGAVTVALASQPGLDSKVKGIILQNTFTKIKEMVDLLMPLLSYFTILLNNHWQSIDKINKIRQPILFIKALQDELVPTEMMDKLNSEARSCAFKDQYVISEGSHNVTWSLNPSQYFERVERFLKRAIESKL